MQESYNSADKTQLNEKLIVTDTPLVTNFFKASLIILILSIILTIWPVNIINHEKY